MNKHNALILEYANDWIESGTPWKRWEYYSAMGEWSPLSGHPNWHPENNYRRKPTTIRIGDYVLSEPYRGAMMAYQTYYTPLTPGACKAEWSGSLLDVQRQRYGLVHLDRESAEIHGRALVSLTEDNNATTD